MKIDLWTIDRDPTANLAALAACLSQAEQERALRLRIAERREAFIYNRAMVRRILGSYADIDAADVPLATSPQGKPFWSRPVKGVQLAFNLGHRADLSILAVTSGESIGVDLEVVDERTNYDAIAREALSPRELAIYQQLPQSERPGAVLRAWTRKEAFLKALGLGLARPLCDIEVTFLMHEAPRLLVTGSQGEAASDWFLHSWSPRPGWFAAAAAPQECGSPRIDSFSVMSLRDRYSSLNQQSEPALAAPGRSHREE